MILKKIKTLLITVSAVTVLLNNSAFSATVCAAENASPNVTLQSTNVSNKSTVDLKKLKHNLNRLFNAGLVENNIKGTNTNAAIKKYGLILRKCKSNYFITTNRTGINIPSL